MGVLGDTKIRESNFIFDFTRCQAVTIYVNRTKTIGCLAVVFFVFTQI
jgi:hypothetical protein